MASLRVYGTPGERAQQTQYWANYYPSQQRANAQFDLSAWSAAQDAQYRQDQADAAAQQQDFANRVNLSRFATGMDAAERAAAEDARRFKINTVLAGLPRKERMLENARAEGDEVNAIEFAKQEVAETADAFEQAQKRLESAKGAYSTRFNEVQKELPAGQYVFNNPTGLFVPKPGYENTPGLNVAIAKANDTLARHNSEYGLAQQEFKTSAELFQQSQRKLPPGTQVVKKDGKWVINSPALRRQFSWEAPPTPEVSVRLTPDQINLSKYQTLPELQMGAARGEITSPQAIRLIQQTGMDLPRSRGPIDMSRYARTMETGTAPPLRPAVPFGNGSVGTVLSIGVGDERGEWVIPTIVNGRVLPQDDAIRLWREGRNPALGGPFKTPQEGAAFAEQFHRQEENRLFGNQAQPRVDLSQFRRGLSKFFDPRLRWDAEKDEWTLAPVPAMSRSSTPAAAYLVPVFNPAGQPVKIRRSQLTDALSKGYRLR